jgi:uncharacterized membrane protein/YHS domain-containing protein
MVLLAWSGSVRAKLVNQYCPVISEEKADPGITIDYRGQTIAFCCDRCLARFNADPGKYLANLPQFVCTASSAAVGKGQEDGHDQHRQQDQDNQEPDEEHTAGHQHDHSAQGDERPPLLGRLHPVIVHFPVAGIPLALLGFAAWLATGREAFAKADVPPMLVGTVAAVAAVATGNIAHDSMSFSPTLHEIVERHQLMATTVMIISLVLTAIRLWRWNRMSGSWRWIYVGGLVILAALLGFVGFLGGSLVFGPDHLKF